MTEELYTDIEAIVLRWLIKNKINFQFATSLGGGFYELGGIVVDFLLPEDRLAWRVMGEYWHRGITPEGKDLIQREELEAEGWTVVDLWGSDLMERPEQTLRLALEGQEII